MLGCVNKINIYVDFTVNFSRAPLGVSVRKQHYDYLRRLSNSFAHNPAVLCIKKIVGNKQISSHFLIQHLTFSTLRAKSERSLHLPLSAEQSLDYKEGRKIRIAIAPTQTVQKIIINK
jgi:hypothetical protein